MNGKLPPGTLDKLWSDPTNWRAPGFYYCKNDPRTVVPKRRKWFGWTPNFAHASAWVGLFIGIATTLGAIIYLKKSGHDAWIIPVVALMAIYSCVDGWYRSSPGRYEENH